MNNILDRVEILLQQGRFEDAEQLVGPILAEYPQDIEVQLAMARIKLGQKLIDDSKQYARKAISINPEHPTPFYILSIIEFEGGNYKESEELIRQCIHKMPHNSGFFAHLAHIKIITKDFEEALEYANQGLSIDPEDLSALNMKSMALNKLKRTDEAFKVIEEALNQNPDDTHTHANFGWELLEKGKFKEAQVHFGESLKNHPNNEYAKAGLVEAMKARNPIYRLFLKYAFWMSNLKGGFQMGIIVGLFLLVNVLQNVADKNPAIAPFITPIVIAYIVFALSSWMIVPISNLFLRINKYGRYALGKEEIIVSNITGALLSVSFIGLIGSLVSGMAGFTALGVWGFSMIIPVSVLFAPTKPNKKLILRAYTLGLLIVGILAVGVTFATGNLFNEFSTIYLWGIILFQWVANALIVS